MQLKIKTSSAVLLGLGVIRILHTGPDLAPAGLVDTTGSIQTLTAPPDVSLSAWEHDGKTRLFQERMAATLSQDLNVDIGAPGNYRGALDLAPNTITAGSVVDSWLIHQDKVGGQGHILTSGSVTFDCDIIGVIIMTQSLDASDQMVGAVGTLYGTGREEFRGLDLPNGRHDAVTISDDRRTLSFTMLTAEASDQIRVITASVPAPGGLALLATSLLTGLRRRRR